MVRNIYIYDDDIALAEYCPETDTADWYECWKDPATEAGYNHRMDDTYEEFSHSPIRSRFLAMILRRSDNTVMGTVFLSPKNCPPDLAIMLYRPYRGQGYGTAAFSLALQYCFETFDLPEIYAGCYEHNHRSRRMLEKCGFVPHPEGDQLEEHYLDGSPVTQRDFVKYRI